MTYRSLLLLLGACLLLLRDVQAQEEKPVLVSTEWLAEHLEDDGLVILHVAMMHMDRPSAWIPGARYVDYHDVEDEVDGLPIELPPLEDLVDVFQRAGVSNDKHVVVYGSNPAHLAARVFMTLEYLGHRGKASVLDGGLERWLAEGRPTKTEAAEGPRGTFTAHLHDDVLISSDDLAEHLDDPRFTLLDARPAEQYAPGFIPGAYNLFWRDLLVSDEDPRLKALDAVQARFNAAGAHQESVVVNYCQIGMRASYTYLISRYLGYETRFYDGSWSEWGRRGDLPREKATP